MEVLLLLVSFAIVLTGALIFTNAVEWIGHRLEVGVGAVGSILAAVGTAMPETLIAIVALLGVKEGSEDIAIGAIVGAPFLLATLAMGLVGLFAYLYRDKRDQGVQLNVHRPDPGARPRSSSSSSSPSPGCSPGARRRRSGFRSGSPSCSPTPSTSASPCGAGETCRAKSRSTR